MTRTTASQYQGSLALRTAQQQSAAAVFNREALAALDDELDRRLAAAEALRARLERDDARNHKIRRLRAIEEDNTERQQRSAVPPAWVLQPTWSGTAGAPACSPTPSSGSKAPTKNGGSAR